MKERLMNQLNKYAESSHILEESIIEYVKEMGYTVKLDEEKAFSTYTTGVVGVVTEIIVEEEDSDVDVLYVKVDLLDDYIGFTIIPIDDENLGRYDLLYDIAKALLDEE